MDCAVLRLAQRVILLRKIHQLAALGSNGVQILGPSPPDIKNPAKAGLSVTCGRDRLRRVAAGPSGDFRCRENASARLRLGSNRVQILGPFSVRYKKPRLRGAFHIWRRGRDSNPRYGLSRTLTFQASPFDHSGTSPKTYLICIVRC